MTGTTDPADPTPADSEPRPPADRADATPAPEHDPPADPVPTPEPGPPADPVPTPEHGPPTDPAIDAADPAPADPADPTPTLALRPPVNRVERRAIIWWMLQSLFVGVPLLAGALIANVVWGSQAPWLVLTIPVAVVMLVIGAAVEPLWRYRIHRWETTHEAIYATSGWVVREWRAAPLSRVQTVDAIRGPLEQLLGLSTLRVTTASARGSIDIGGLDAETAARVAAELTGVAERTPGDAT